MRNIDLTGEWVLYKDGQKRSYPAYVPGCIHGAMSEAGAVEDPYCGTNLREAGDLLRSGWRYEKVFVAEDLSEYRHVMLHFDGVTSPAEITLNGRKAGALDGAFKAAEIDVRKLLKSGKNTLCVKFEALKGGGVPGGDDGGAGRVLARSFGVWGDVSLQARSCVRITDLRIETVLKSGAAAELNLCVESERYDAERTLELLARVCYKGNILSEVRVPYREQSGTLKLEVRNPQLWWPAAMGDQPLYEVTLDILEGRSCLEHVSRRIGLRHFEAREESVGNRRVRRFYINGKPFLLKGAEWVPADLYIARLTRVEYAHLVKSAVIANINLLRVSGAGVYENDCFYNLCDEYGICVWQDVTGAGSEPREIAGRMDHALRRLRHHPALVIWYGGDLEEKLRSRVAASAGLAGAHLHWMTKLPEEIALVNYGGDKPTIPGCSGPREVARFLKPAQCNIAHPVSRFHLSAPDDIRSMVNGFAEDFRMPVSFDSLLWLSQIQQGVAVKWQVERMRMLCESNAGYIFRRLNDGWPCCSPSSLDYYGLWKALHYMTRRYYAALSVCGLCEPESGQVAFYAFNDNDKPFKGEICWSVSLMDGAIVAEGSRKVSVAAAARGRPVRTAVADLIARHGASNMVMWVYLTDEQGNKVSWNVVLFCRPFELSLQPARMRAEIRRHDENSYFVTLTSQTPAMWAWVTLDGMDAVYSDNFFCMEPAKPISVKIIPRQRIKLDEFRQSFRIGSLRDLWTEKGALMQMRSGPKKR
jgi:beta-mannosidase